MHPEFRRVLPSRAIHTIDELRRESHAAQELLKAYATYKPPPSQGTLEPSLTWKQGTTSSIGTTAPSVSDQNKINLASIDPFTFFHNKEGKNKSVTFSNPPSNSCSQSPVPSSGSRPSSPRPTHKKCFECDSPDHIRRNCPKLAACNPRNEHPPNPKKQ